MRYNEAITCVYPWDITAVIVGIKGAHATQLKATLETKMQQTREAIPVGPHPMGSSFCVPFKKTLINREPQMIFVIIRVLYI